VAARNRLEEFYFAFRRVALSFDLLFHHLAEIEFSQPRVII
jgi:hypothetical protein